MDSQSAEPLHVLYRPKTLEAVVGQQAVVASLKTLLSGKKVPHAFLLTGPSGTGKTTLARIIAAKLGINEQGLIEIDAASNSGIENMRNIIDMVRYVSLSKGGRKFVLVDEAHSLSKATWQSLLKPIEEPPEHVFWALCTTEPDKVPETIRTRCVSYNLKSVNDDDISDLLNSVVEKEKIKIEESMLEMIARQSRGSPRRALVYLQQLIGVKDKKEALRLLETGVGEEEQAINLARMICTGKGFTWEAALKIIQNLEGESPEGVRLIIVNYAAAVLKTSKKPEPLLAVLSAFRGPYNPSEKWAPLYLSLGDLLYG